MTATAYVEIPLNHGKVALVDVDDVPTIGGLHWAATVRKNTAYAIARMSRKEGHRAVLMHRLIAGQPVGLHVDHRNGDGLDNRRANLRIATASQNGANSRQGRGSSRFKGVSWYRTRGRWEAYICKAGRTRRLGYFHDEISAAHAYDAAARELFGEFAALNFPGPGEQSARPSSKENGSST